MAFGGKVVSAKKLMHGKTSAIHADGKTLYEGIKQPFQAMRYHSLAVSRDGLPDCLEVSSESEDGEIMGLRHKDTRHGRHSVSSGIHYDACRKTAAEEFFKNHRLDSLNPKIQKESSLCLKNI